jgi:hypothetical protein
MAGRGPAPKAKDRRARTNSEPTGATVLPLARCRQPDLPAGTIPWPDRTIEWWSGWGSSPLAVSFTWADWEFLLDTALIHADVWGNYNLDRLPELRLRVAKFGVTPEDRARLRITFADADEKDAKRSARSGTNPTVKRFGHLKAAPAS